MGGGECLRLRVRLGGAEAAGGDWFRAAVAAELGAAAGVGAGGVRVRWVHTLVEADGGAGRRRRRRRRAEQEYMLLYKLTTFYVEV